MAGMRSSGNNRDENPRGYCRFCAVPRGFCVMEVIRSAHRYDDFCFFQRGVNRNDMAAHRSSVDGHGNDAFLNTVRILYRNVIGGSAVFPGDREVTEPFRNAGIN